MYLSVLKQLDDESVLWIRNTFYARGVFGVNKSINSMPTPLCF